MKKSQAYTVAAIILGTSILGSVLAWGQTNNFQLLDLGVFQIFPLLGLLAFVTMWSQYMVEAIMHATKTEASIKPFFTYSSLFVLICILLHPTLLIAKLYANGAGLPPDSYAAYVGPAMTWVVGLGTLSLLAFLAFEFRNFFTKRGLWKYVVVLNDIAIVAIFYHGLRLGSTIQSSLFMPVWYFLGVTLGIALAYKYLYSHLQANTVAS